MTDPRAEATPRAIRNATIEDCARLVEITVEEHRQRTGHQVGQHCKDFSCQDVARTWRRCSALRTRPSDRTSPGTSVRSRASRRPEAYANGSRIVKVLLEPGDSTAVGALGTVLGSMRAPPGTALADEAFYFVEWDYRKGYAVGVRGRKIGLWVARHT